MMRSQGALEGLSPSAIAEKTRASFHRVWALSFMVWTPIQAVNLYFVPVPFQPVVVSAVNVGWRTILSLLNHYHDYGSPRLERSPSGGLRAVENTSAPPHTWESERTHLRGRIRQLTTENSQLRRKVGELEEQHGAAARAGKAPRTAEPR
jgi:hypothetical protein